MLHSFRSSLVGCSASSRFSSSLDSFPLRFPSALSSSLSSSSNAVTAFPSLYLLSFRTPVSTRHRLSKRQLLSKASLESSAASLLLRQQNQTKSLKERRAEAKADYLAKNPEGSNSMKILTFLRAYGPQSRPVILAHFRSLSTPETCFLKSSNHLSRLLHSLIQRGRLRLIVPKIKTDFFLYRAVLPEEVKEENRKVWSSRLNFLAFRREARRQSHQRMLLKHRLAKAEERKVIEMRKAGIGGWGIKITGD
jgi:hypothetical protein